MFRGMLAIVPTMSTLGADATRVGEEGGGGIPPLHEDEKQELSSGHQDPIRKMGENTFFSRPPPKRKMNVVWSGVSRIPHGLLKNKRSTNKSSRYPCPVFFFLHPVPLTGAAPARRRRRRVLCIMLVGSRPHGRPAVALSMSLNTGSAWLRCDSGAGEGGGGGWETEG